MVQIGGPEKDIGIKVPDVETPSSLKEVLAAGTALIAAVARGEITEEEAQLQQAYLLREVRGFHHLMEDLHNKGWFTERLEAEMNRSRRYGSPLSIIGFDLDNFKAVNDLTGDHLVGDETLIKVSQMLVNGRKSDAVAGIGTEMAGMGGDEFGVILPATDKFHALVLARRILRTVPTLSPVNPKTGAVIPITASIGVVDLLSSDYTPQDILRRVDQTIYGAKEAGRDSICLFENDPLFSIDKLKDMLSHSRRINLKQKAETIRDILDHTTIRHLQNLGN